MNVKINADLGEGTGVENEIMPMLTSCSIACGGHTGDLDSMNSTVEIAIKHNVKIGAHPSYPDKKGFGRRMISISNSDLKKTILNQIESLSNILNKKQLELDHIKTHGALYNYSANNYDLGMFIIELVNKNFENIPLYVPSGTLISKLAQENNILIKNEAFLDRNYNDDLTLVERKLNDAMITDPDMSLKHLQSMIDLGKVKTISGKLEDIELETICIHGDQPKALFFAKTIYNYLNSKGLI